MARRKATSAPVEEEEVLLEGQAISAEEVMAEMRKHLGYIVQEHVNLIANTKSAAAKASLIKLAYDIAGVYDKGNAPNVQRNFLKLMEKLEVLRKEAGGEAVPTPPKSKAEEEEEEAYDDSDGDEESPGELEEEMPPVRGLGESDTIGVLGTLPGGTATRRGRFVSKPEVGDNNYNSISSKLRRKRAKGQQGDGATVAGELLPTV